MMDGLQLPAAFKNDALPDDIVFDSGLLTASSPLTDCFKGFRLAPVKAPAYFCRDVKMLKVAPRLMDFDKGTTVLGFVFQGGAIVATDSRASMGCHVADMEMQKYIFINENMCGAISGVAADCLYWTRWLSKALRLHQLQNGKTPSVAAASKLLSNTLFQFKGHGISAGILLVGKDMKGYHAYFLLEDGARIKSDIVVSGSGCTYAYGILDSHFRWEMTLSEAVEMAERAIYHATYRDGGSGQTVSVVHVSEEGTKLLVKMKDVLELHEKYTAEKNASTQKA